MDGNWFINELIDSGISESAITGFIAIMIFVLVFACAAALVFYLLRAVGVWKMAKTAEISSPWVAFIPVVNSFTLGKIAEKYRKRDGTKSAKFGVALLALNIITLVIGILLTVFTVNSVIEILKNAEYAVEADIDMTIDMFSSLIPVIILYVLIMAAAFAYMIVYYVALWRVFSSFDYRNATLFTVLSVFFSFLGPIFLFILRNRQPVFDPREHFNFFNQSL